MQPKVDSLSRRFALQTFFDRDCPIFDAIPTMKGIGRNPNKTNSLLLMAIC